MLEYIRSKIAEYIDDFAYKAKHSVKHILGKAGIKGSVRGAISMAAPAAEGVATGAATGAVEEAVAVESFPLIGSALKMVGITGKVSKTAATIGIAGPIISAFGLWMENEEYKHRREMLLNHFRPEIAAWLDNGKRPETLTQADMETAAYGDPARNIPGNPTLSNALYQSKLERNWGMGISVISNLGATAVTAVGEEHIHKAVEAGLGLLFSTTALATTMGSIATGVGTMLALGVVAYAAYVAIKTPLHFMAEQVFGVEKDTVADKIGALRREREEGRGITQAQVLDIYLAAHPDMEEHIRTAQGKTFARLDEAQQQAVLAEFGPRLNLPKLTEDLNEGRMRPEELAFAIHSQSSGVQEGPATGMPPPESLLAKAWHKCKGAFKRPTPDNPNFVLLTAASPDGDEQVALQSYAAATGGNQVSHVEMVGQRRGKDGSVNWSQFVEQSRSTAEISV